MAAVAAVAMEQQAPCKLQQESAAAELGSVFEVVGGVNSGGIIVRVGKGPAAPEAGERLCTGSQIRALEYDAGRLAYELIAGAGPARGWVSIATSGKPLLCPVQEPMPPLSKEVDEALQWYSARLVDARESGKGDLILDRVAVLDSEEDGRDGLGLEFTSNRDFDVPDVAEDSDGEAVALCRHCGLPLGQVAYAKGTDGAELLHSECTAQSLMQHLRNEEEMRKSQDAALKKSRHDEYDIGWKADTIPSNAVSAKKLGCTSVPQGMCCLVLMEDNSVQVAPTFEPAGAVNLEYLSLALQVRRAEGREPLFSLDPMETLQDSDPAASMQVKRFEPEWLAGTSMGEVMFQADYHLKELSMGEYEQPVVGMKSCFDYSEKEGHEKEWTAREWFVVRKAEVHMSEDSVLVPQLKMGVEAREQFLGPDGHLEDAPLTRPDHPLVKYAEAFTHNFDLIAERRSVVAQLREVAKASVMAKFMMESGTLLEESWFTLGEQIKAVCCLEVPQLWNDRCFTKVQIQEGTVVTAEQVKGAKIHSVYGGVDFGIDRFRLSAPSRIATSVVAGRAALGRPSSTLMATSQAGLSMGPTRQFTRLAAPLSARASLTAPSRLAAPLSARAGLAAPLSAMSAARPASSLMATSRLSMGAPRAGLAAPLSAMSAARPASSLMATSRLSMAAPQVATARLSMGMPRGVDFGIDRFRLSAPSRIATSVVAGRAALGRPSSTLMATSQAGLSMGPTRQFTRLAAPLSARASLTAPSRLAAPLSARAGLAAPLSAMSAARPASSLMATSRLSMGAPRAGLAAPLSAMSAARPASSLMATSRLSMAAPQVATARLSMGMPRGVDLNLEQFNLSAPEEVGSYADVLVAPEGAEQLAISGKAFWSSLHDGSAAVFSEEDKKLLADVFNARLSDRQEEGDDFLPPPTSPLYMHKLKALVKEEAAVRQKRREHFFSGDFSMADVGPLFPASWASSIEMEGASAEGQEQRGALRHVRDLGSVAPRLEEVLPSAVPAFDKVAEDGIRFLVYRLGGLEVRATQEPRGRRVVGAVFTVGAVAKGCQDIGAGARITKATEYVEKAVSGALRCQSFVVLETAEGNCIVTEKLADGTVAWAEDPEDLAVRSALAKVVRTAECGVRGITVGDVRGLWAQETSDPQGASPSDRKRYAQAAYCRVAGKAGSGFRGAPARRLC